MGSQTKYLSCAETAVMIRQSLKECFPGIKFSVKSKTYSMGASIDVSWTDGPNIKSVYSIIKRFESAYFDGMTDYKGGKTHLLNGQEVNFGADYVFSRREYSDSLIQTAIDLCLVEMPGNCPDPARVTVENWKNGNLWNMSVYDNAVLSHDNWNNLIGNKLESISVGIFDSTIIPAPLMGLGGVVRTY